MSRLHAPARRGADGSPGQREKPARRPRSAPSKPKSLGEQAHDRLRQEIIGCVLSPGADINEQELSLRLGMSKTPVREALARLVVEGLVEAFPRRGYRVTPVTVQDVTNLFTLRKGLEGVAAELAAVRMTDVELDELEEVAGARYTLGETVTIDAFIEANNAFHGAIALGARVPRLHGLIVGYLEESARLLHMGAVMRDVNPETIEDHNRIVLALRGRDPAAARQAIVEHTENTRMGLLSSLISDRNSTLEL